MKTSIHFWSYVAQFFLEWEMFHTNVIEKVKTPFMFDDAYKKSRSLQENVENIVESGRQHEKVAHVLCMLNT
jgi:hypothetical protein